MSGGSGLPLSGVKILLAIRSHSGKNAVHAFRTLARRLGAVLTLQEDLADVMVFQCGGEALLHNALARGRIVVTPEWLGACESAGVRVDVRPFQMTVAVESGEITELPPRAKWRRLRYQWDPSGARKVLSGEGTPVLARSPVRQFDAEQAKIVEGTSTPRRPRPEDPLAVGPRTPKRRRSVDASNKRVLPTVVGVSGAMPRDERGAIVGIMEALGCRVATRITDVFGRNVMHPSFIIVEESISAPSPMLLWALAAGAPLVTPAYAMSALNAGRLLPYDPPADEHCHVLMGTVRTPRMLAGESYHLFGQSEFPSNAVYGELLEMVGACMSRNPSAAGLTAFLAVDDGEELRGLPKRKHEGNAVTAPLRLDETEARAFYARYPHVPCVVLKEWLVDSLLRGERQPYEPYIVYHQSWCFAQTLSYPPQSTTTMTTLCAERNGAPPPTAVDSQATWDAPSLPPPPSLPDLAPVQLTAPGTVSILSKVTRGPPGGAKWK